MQSAAAFARLRNDPALGAFFESVYSAAMVDLPIIKDAAAAWTANQSAGNLAALSAAVNTLATEVNAKSGGQPSREYRFGKRVGAIIVLCHHQRHGAAAVWSKRQAATSKRLLQVLALTSRSTQEQVAKAYGVAPDFAGGM